MYTLKTPTRLCTWRCTFAGTVSSLLLAILHGCGTLPEPLDSPAHTSSAAEPGSAGQATVSHARNARDYRRDAARHLYARQPERIYPGRPPPMLYAVGVLHVDIDRTGQVQALRW